MERLRYPVLRKRIETFDIEIKHRWNINDEAYLKQAAPTFPGFDPGLVPPEIDEELFPMPDGPPNPNSFTLEEYGQYVSSHIKMPLGDK